MKFTHWKAVAIGGSVLVVGAVAGALALPDTATATAKVTVYKSPTCGCCAEWAEHLRSEGFEVEERNVTDLEQVKREHGVPQMLGACHTAVVEGYVVEGHVPADVIRNVLEERPAVAGIAVPGMPMGSPGMEGPRKDPYNVVAFDAEGGYYIYDKR